MKREDTFFNHRNDLLKLIIAIIVILLLSIEFDLFEEIHTFLEAHEKYEVDEIMFVVFTTAILSIWYSIRRYLEIKRILNETSDLNHKLKKELFKKEELLSENLKMVAMGEMLGNIAHQWRQPLNVITTVSSGMKFHKEMGTLTDEIFMDSIDGIVRNATYLSSTIDDFRNFLIEDKVKMQYFLHENIKKNLLILNPMLKQNYIETILDLDRTIIEYNVENELTQAFLNIVNNAKDAFNEHNIDHKYIFIKTFKEDSNVYITIHDNAGGIPEGVLKKVFDPYFTTKHQTQGTGLGLYIVYKMIVESMKGELFVENVSYRYKGEEYKGAKFTILLPNIVK